MKCIVCGREKKVENEGRIIDGNWKEDKEIPQKYWGKWVCSFPCYKKLIPSEPEPVEKISLFDLIDDYVKKHYPEGYVAVLYVEALEGYNMTTRKMKELLKFFDIDYPTNIQFVFKKIYNQDFEKIDFFKGVGYIAVYRDGEFFYENT